MSTLEAITSALRTKRASLIEEWAKDLLPSDPDFAARHERDYLVTQWDAILERLGRLLESAAGEDEDWGPIRKLVADVARTRAEGGEEASETARFVLSLRRPLLRVIDSNRSTSDHLAVRNRVEELVERLALYTVDVFAQNREAQIHRQAESILELSCPIVRIWESTLLCVIIGTVDSTRAQELLESVLEAVRNTDAQIVILDITRVTAIDTMEVQHLFTIVRGARFMGAEVVVTGVTPAIAASVTKLHVDLETFHAKRSLRLGLGEAFRLLGVRVDGRVR